MQTLHYLDFDLQFVPEGDHYVAQVLQSPAGEASTVFTLPFTQDRVENLVLKMSPLRRRTRGVSSEELAAARELGAGLFAAVFSGETLAALRRSLDEANRHDATGLRLKLRLQDSPDLADLPWEFMFDAALDRFLAQSDYTPIVRYIDMPQPVRPLQIALPLNILVMISSPEDPDYPALDVALEKQRLEQALAPLTSTGKVTIDWLEKPSLSELQRRLRSKAYHVFHFIGHGGFDPVAGEGVLVLEDDNGKAWRAAGYRIGPLLNDHRSLRLAVLNSCEGARNSRNDPFGSMAASIIRQGIPAVVAMQFEITDGAAITFSSDFYGALADGYAVDAAVAEARKGILVQANDVEWGTPVLYMRSPDGMLFDLSQATIPAPTVTPSSLAPTVASVETPPIEASSPAPAPVTTSAPEPPHAAPAAATPAAVTLELQATQPAGRFGGAIFELNLHNAGDVDAAVRLSLAAGSGATQVSLPRDAVKVPGHSTATLSLRARPRRRRWTGARESRSFTIAASGDGDDSGNPPTATGDYDDQPYGLLPIGGGGVFAAVVAVVVFLLLRGGGGSSPLPPESNTDVAQTVDQIYFQSTRDTPGHEEIYVMKPDGSGVRRITTTPQSSTAGDPVRSSTLPDATSDGQTIVFASNRGGTTSELYLMAADGSNVRQLPTVPNADKHEPNLSADGKRVVFEVKTTLNGKDNFDIYVMNLDGSGLKNLTNDAFSNIDPYWSPDGTKIAFGSDREDNQMQVWVMDSDGSNKTRLTNSNGFETEPAWSPDGQTIAFESNRSGSNGFDIWTMNADGSGQLPVETQPTDDFDPAWSRDSRRIAFTAGSGSSFDVDLVNVDGTGLVNLTKGQGSSGKPAWSPKRNFLQPVARQPRSPYSVGCYRLPVCPLTWAFAVRRRPLDGQKSVTTLDGYSRGSPPCQWSPVHGSPRRSRS